MIEKGDSIMQAISNSKEYNYILSRYDNYNLGLQSQYDMISLLNKLEAHNETLDSLHHCNGFQDGFCDLVVTDKDGFFTDAEIANAVIETNAFYPSKQSYLEWREEECEQLQELSEMWDDLFANGNIVKTTDGFVELDIV